MLRDLTPFTVEAPFLISHTTNKLTYLRMYSPTFCLNYVSFELDQYLVIYIFEAIQ